MKIHYETQNLFLKSVFSLKDEIQAVNLEDESLENQKNFLLLLRNNDKILPKNEEMIKICFGLLIYNLCFSEAYEQSKIQNSKKEAKFMKSQLLSFFYSKIQILENLKNFTQKYGDLLDANIIKDIIFVFQKFFEFGINEIDELILDVLENIAPFIGFSSDNSENCLIFLKILETIIVRYKEESESLSKNLLKAIKIQIKGLANLIKNHHLSFSNINDIEEIAKNEKFMLLNNLIFSFLEIISTHKNSTLFYQSFIFEMNEIFNNIIENLEENKLIEELFYLYLFHLYELFLKNNESSQKKLLTLIFFSIYEIYQAKLHNLEETKEDSKIFKIYHTLMIKSNLIENCNELKEILIFCRGLWQEQRAIETNCLLAIIEICFSHIIKIKKDLSENNPNIDQLFLSELLKFFLAVYLFIGDEKKEKFIQPLIQLVFLFINRNFPNQIVLLANQIIKHIINNTKENILKENIQKLPQELSIALHGLIELEKAENLDKSQKTNESKDYSSEHQQKQIDSQSQGVGQGKIKLKLFGSKKE